MPGQSVLAILADFKFESVDASEPPSSIFQIDCAFELIYELGDSYHPTPEEIDAFKKGNAVFNCWPYVREFVQNMAARMGFQPPPIPLLRIKPKQEEPEKPIISDTEVQQPTPAGS